MENKTISCYFPRLDGRETGYGRLYVESVKLPSISQFCSTNNVDSYAFFQVAWALIVNRFAESDPLLGVKIVEHAGMDSINIGPEDVTAYGATVDLNTTVKEMFEDIHPLEQSHLLQFNTLLYFSSSGLNEVAWKDPLISHGAAAEENHQSFEVILAVLDCDREPSFWLLYNKSTLSDRNAETLSKTIIQAMHSILYNFEQKATNVNLFSLDHKKEIFHLTNRPSLETQDISMLDIVRHRTKERPSHIALCSWEGEMSYDQLDEMSTKIAQHLVSIGIAPESAVAACFEKSMWAIVTIIGVMKSGATCVPLDPALPLQRLQNTIQQANAHVILASPQHAKLLSHMERVITISEETIRKLPAQTESCSTPMSSSHVAYILFTSGSTGSPKGCYIEHKALLNMETHGKALQIQPDSRVLQFASFGFSLSMVEIFCPLVIGGTIIIPSDTDRLNNLTGAINAFKVNWAVLTPTVIGSMNPENVTCLRTLALAGEPARAEDIHPWTQTLNVVNCFGCTEWAGVVCVQPKLESPRNIGFPVTAKAWLVDTKNHDNLAPPGAPAELMIAGQSLARGYLSNEKTSQSFIKHPAWSKNYKDSIYKTGDLVRLSDDGSLVSIGRKGLQIKVRGMRVEVGEVEHHVREAFKASETIVEAPVPDNDKSPILLAFVLQTKPNAELDSAIVDEACDSFRYAVGVAKRHLEAILPSYMMPDIFVPLSRMPLTVSGKIDRQALRNWTTKRTREDLMPYCTATIPRRSPSTATEATIYQIVIQILSLDETSATLSVDDNFFQVGGDSVQAMRLVNECREAGITITVQDVFQEKTIANLALCIDTEMSYVLVAKPTADEAGYARNSSELRELLENKLPAFGVSYNDVEDIAPCSAMQEGMLVSQVKEPSHYQMKLLWHVLPVNLGVAVDINRLKRAWQKTVERHPMLRTIFVESMTGESTWLQVVLKPVPIQSRAHIIDEGSWPPANTYCSYEQGLMPCLLLCQSRNGLMQCMLHISHVSMDAASIAIIQSDLSLAYDGSSLMSNFPMITYSAYVKHLLENTQGLIYWNDYLAGCTPCIFPRLNILGTNSISEFRRVNHPLPLESILVYSKKSGITMANIFHVAWGLVLSTYTRQANVCFGYLKSSRDALSGLDHTIGPLINTLICRLDLTKDPGLETLLEQTQAEFAAGIRYQNFSLAEAFHSSMTGDMFNTTISCPTDMQFPEASSVRFQEMDKHAPAEYDLGVEITRSGTSLGFSITYWSLVFAESQVQSIARTFVHALTQITNNSTRKVSELTSCSKDDFKQILEWTKEVPETEEYCVHDLIHLMALQQPSAPAVCAWDGDLTYEELDKRSSQLAGHLKTFEGAGRNSFIPICFEKSKLVIVSVLAVLKSGSAFVLLDPSHPLERLRSICQSSKASLILTSPKQAAKLKELTSHSATRLVVVEVDGLWESNSDYSRDFSVLSDDPAYAVFTSGTTGKPKGAVILHSSFVTATYQFMKTVGLTSASRVLQVSSFAFDVSMSEILQTLIAGGCICMMSDNDKGDLAACVKSFQANHLMITPSVARLLLTPASTPTLKTLLLTGEAMSQVDAQTWAPHVNLFNTYGPCECSITTTVQSKDVLVVDARNIGPAVGCACWVVDSCNPEKLLPIGAIGELLVEGPNVGRGYLEPDGSSQGYRKPPSWLQNVRNPSRTGRKTDRLVYLTGDLVQFLSDGSLRYWGRKNVESTKIRGQRLELCEVESHVRNCFERADIIVDVVTRNQTASLVAFIHSDKFPLQTRLTGESTAHEVFVAPSEHFHLAVEKAKETISKSLPPYMVPDVIFQLSHIPLAPTGKTDRKGLNNAAVALSPDLWVAFSSFPTDKQTPSTVNELKVQQLFASILGVSPESVGLDSHFFQLGGDSMLALKLASATISQGLHLRMVDIFENPRVVDLAKVLDKPRDQPRPSSRAAPTALSLTSPQDSWHHKSSDDGYLSDSATGFSLVGITDPAEFLRHSILPMIPTQNAQILDVLPTTGCQQWYIRSQQSSVFFLAIPDEINEHRLRDATQELMRKYWMLRSTFVPYGDEYLRVVFRQIDIPVLCHRENDPVSFSRSISQKKDTVVPFGMPNFQITLISNGDTRSVILLRLSHAQYDGISLGILLRDLETAYGGNPIGSATVDFLMYMKHRTAQQTPSAFEFWRKYLDGASVTRINGLQFGVNDAESQEIDICAVKGIPFPTPPLGITVATLFKAAWSFVLAELTSCKDIVFCEVVGGRSLPMDNVEEVVGPCYNEIPTRTIINPQWTALELMQHVRDQHSIRIPYETIDLTDIIAESTPWPKGTKLDFVAHYMGGNIKPTITWGGRKTSLDAVAYYDVDYLEVTANPADDGKLNITVESTSKLVSADCAERIAREVCDVILKFEKNPEERLYGHSET